MLSKIKKFLNDKKYKYKPKVIEYVKVQDLRRQGKNVIWLTMDVFWTGLLAWYAINHNNFLSWGLRLILVEHYIILIITKIKEKHSISLKENILDEVKQINNKVTKIEGFNRK